MLVISTRLLRQSLNLSLSHTYPITCAISYPHSEIPNYNGYYDLILSKNFDQIAKWDYQDSPNKKNYQIT